MAFMGSVREALSQDNVDLLYIQEYWSGRFDHIIGGVDLPVVGADHGGVSDRVVKWFKPKAFKKAVLCYGQTENECRIVERYGAYAVLAPNGCNVSEFFPDPAVPRSKTVLTVTRTHQRSHSGDDRTARGMDPGHCRHRSGQADAGKPGGRAQFVVACDISWLRRRS